MPAMRSLEFTPARTAYPWWLEGLSAASILAVPGAVLTAWLASPAIGAGLGFAAFVGIQIASALGNRYDRPSA